MRFPQIGIVLEDEIFPLPSANDRELPSKAQTLLPHCKWLKSEIAMLARYAVGRAYKCCAFIERIGCHSTILGMDEDWFIPELLLPEKLSIALCTTATESGKFGIGIPHMVVAKGCRFGNHFTRAIKRRIPNHQR